MKTQFFIAWLLCLIMPISTFAQRRNARYEDYIRKYSNIAIQQMQKHKIPASITMAQGILESGAGTSNLALATNNHFGIKKGANWNGPVYEHPDDSKHDLFRVYDNVEQGFEDHSAILLKPRYQKLFNLKTNDYKGWARGLKECGYATSPTYAERLINIIETYELYQLDDQHLAMNYNSFNEPFQHTHINTPQKHNQNNINNTQTNNSYHTTNINTRQLIENNGIPCVVANDNDTWISLAKELGIRHKTLLKYNEATPNLAIHKGDFIYLKKKANKGPRYMKKKWHKVSNGETMYFIAQYYGIKIEKLYKMNFKSPDYVPFVGDLLKVR